MVNYQKNEYHQQRHPELLESEELRTAWSHFADLAYFQHVTDGQTVLDFGGGLGNNLLSVSQRAQAWMVEPSPLGRQLARHGGIKTAAQLDELKHLRFDTVLCRHVLEHVDHPLIILRDLKEALTPYGVLVLVLPCESMYTLPDLTDIDHHLYCWHPRALANLLEKAGFKILRIRYEYFGAKRKMLPLYRRGGGKAYAHMVRWVGRVFRYKELVVEARRDNVD